MDKESGSKGDGSSNKESKSGAPNDDAKPRRRRERAEQPGSDEKGADTNNSSNNGAGGSVPMDVSGAPVKPRRRRVEEAPQEGGNTGRTV